jgi:outer membrane lipoprotein carrier protein
MKPATWALKPATFIICVLLLPSLNIGCVTSAFAVDVAAVVAGLQRRYASVETITGSFQQTYRAPGMDQVESGVFWMKKPGLMRWEYRHPEEKLFVADGHESFLYVPGDRQVTVQPLSAADLRNTPLDLLLGSGDIFKNFAITWEEGKPQEDRAYLIRLTPRRSEADYSSLVLELDQDTYDIRRIVIRESSGNTSEFLFRNLAANVKISNKEFQFKIPKGIEVIRINSE